MAIDEDEVFNKLDTALDVQKTENAVDVKAEKSQKNDDDDYEYTKNKLKELIDESAEVLEHAGDIAKETGEPRSIEVYSSLLKTVSDIAKGVMDNAKSKSTIDKERGLIGNKKDIFVPEGQGNFTQNNQTIFVGTTKELHDLLEKGDAEDNEVIDMENESNDKSNNKNT